MKIFIILLSFLSFFVSCGYRADNNKEYIADKEDGIREYDKNFKEGYIKTEDGVNLYYRFFYNDENNRLLVLNHKENSSLEEWEIMINLFLREGYNIMQYDMRGYGKSKGEKDLSKYISDLEIITGYAFNNMQTISHIVFIGNGFGGNIVLYSSKKYCNDNTSFVILSPDLENEEFKIDLFNKYCDNSKYLFLYSGMDLEGVDEVRFIYNYENIKTYIDRINDYSGVDLLINNPLFLRKILNTND